jgi:hypothetical protein
LSKFLWEGISWEGVGLGDTDRFGFEMLHWNLELKARRHKEFLEGSIQSYIWHF